MDKLEEVKQLPVYFVDNGEYSLVIRAFDEEGEEPDDDITDVSPYLSGQHTNCAWLWEITWDRDADGPETIAAGRCYGESGNEALEKAKACGLAVLRVLAGDET